MPSPATTRAAATCRALAGMALLLLAGCVADGSLQPCADCASPLEPAAAAKEGEAPAKAEKAEKPPPHTLPAALHAYWRAVCSHACAAGPQDQAKDKKNGDNANGSEDKDKKSPPANGDAEKKKDEKDKPAKDNGKNGEDKQDKDEKKEEKDEKKEEKEEPKDAWFSAHAQATTVTQEHYGFRSPYVGTNTLYPGSNSLLPDKQAATSVTTTLFLATRLWEGGELVFNPEVAGGFGLSASTGLAGFPNGEISRVGRIEPDPYIARLLLRQTIGFGGEQEKVEDDVNQVAGTRDVERLTVTVGKFTNTDLVDFNRYSHDPRTQFLNWALQYNGAWDYPANVRGYSYGIGLDYNQKDWALRYTIMGEPAFANGAPIDPHFLKANGQLAEWEGRYQLFDHPGRVRVWGFLNHAHMGNYAESLTEMPIKPDITATRAYRFKYGYGGNVEQELTPDLGAFLKYGWNDGHSEDFAYTAIDRTLALGLALKGRCWCRPNDVFGLAFVANGLAKVHREYLAAGGYDFIIGDGRLNYGLEKILETYYALQINKGIFITLDYQFIDDPAYNRDRGPVSILTGRFHIEL
jgi:high affinity Mn2+ porin